MRTLHFPTVGAERAILIVILSVLATGPGFGSEPGNPAAAPSPRIRRVGMMPNLPEPYAMRDWRQTALDFDQLAFDITAKGQYLPLIHLVRDEKGQVQYFGIPAYVGDTRSENRRFPSYDGVTTMGAVVNASFLGIDKSAGPHDFVRLCQVYFDKRPTHRIVGNGMQANPEATYWYTLFPNIQFLSLADQYPKEEEIVAMARESAVQWARAVEALSAAGGGKPNFDSTGFDFVKMQAASNHAWTEPDAAGGIGWIEYAAWRKWRDDRFLNAARQCLEALSERPEQKNPYYECLLPFGALAAARMNAELGCNYDLNKIINWCFDRSAARIEWTCLASRWDERDVYGLMAGVTVPPWRTWDGGYAFLMNTFSQARSIVPIARYDARYARDIGKWMLHAANAARLFYPDSLPPDQQSDWGWAGDPRHAVAYEGLKYHWDSPTQALSAEGDPISQKWGPCNRSLYSSVFVGIFGAMVARTDVPAILQLDLLVTDLFRDRAYPTFLYYNPYPQSKNITVDAGSEARDLYDEVRGEFIARNVHGRTQIEIAPDSARVVALVPATAPLSHQGCQTLANGVVIDYRRGP